MSHDTEDGETDTLTSHRENQFKRLSRTLGRPFVVDGWVFEDGDKHPLPAEAGGERR